MTRPCPDCEEEIMKTREIALDIIANTFCEGPSATVGGELAETIMKNLEAGGFNFNQPVKTDEHKRGHR